MYFYANPYLVERWKKIAGMINVDTVETMSKICKCKLSVVKNYPFLISIFYIKLYFFLLQIKSKLFGNTKFFTIFLSKHCHCKKKHLEPILWFEKVLLGFTLFNKVSFSYNFCYNSPLACLQFESIMINLFPEMHSPQGKLSTKKTHVKLQKVVGEIFCQSED